MKKVLVSILTIVIITGVMTGFGCLLGIELAESLWIGLSCATIWTVEPIVMGILKSTPDAGKRERTRRIAAIFLVVFALTALVCQLGGHILGDEGLLDWTTNILLGLTSAAFSILFPIAEVYFSRKKKI